MRQYDNDDARTRFQFSIEIVAQSAQICQFDFMSCHLAPIYEDLTKILFSLNAVDLFIFSFIFRSAAQLRRKEWAESKAL